jgi:hypothetical protein
MKKYEGNTNISNKFLQKLVFINNAIDEGWSVKKKESSYIFSKKHENRQEIFDSNYLENFISDNSFLKKTPK